MKHLHLHCGPLLRLVGLRSLCALCLTAAPLAVAAQQDDWEYEQSLNNNYEEEEPQTTVQRTNLDRNIKVIFIDHEPSLPADKVISEMRVIRDAARENDHSVIYYMPNNQEPFIALINAGNSNDPNASDAAFDQLCYALNQPSHNKDAYYDRRRFIELFHDYGLIQDDHTLGYRSVEVQFWLTEEFWQLGYNESIFAPIYFALNVRELIKQNFQFDAYVHPNVLKRIDKKKAFGEKNLGGINAIGVTEYYF